ncbi:unnamed protein product, partial [Brenthis ino]
MRVSEILNSELQQDERLVVYLYKNSHNEVTIYIPNSEKQKVLPEFTLDNNDLLKKNTTVNTNNLFYLNKSDLMLHESSNSLDINSNQLLGIRPDNIILSNQPYLITGYTQFLQIPLNFQNIPNCCGNIVMLLQNLFEKHSHLPINTKEIPENDLKPNENKQPSNVDTLHPEDVWDYIIPNPREENIPLNPNSIHDVLDLIIPQSNEEKPSNSDKLNPQDVFDLLTPPSNEEKPSNLDNVHPQDILDLIISQSKEESPSNSDSVYPQDVLDLIIPPSNKEKPSNSDNVHPQDMLHHILLEINKNKKPADLNNVNIQDVLESEAEIKPLNPGNNYQVDIDSNNIDFQDLMDHQNYENPIIQDLVDYHNDEIPVTQGLVDKQKYTTPLNQDQNPVLIIYGPKQPSNFGKYNDDTLLFLNKYISSLKEKHTHLLNQNKTSEIEGHNGPSQINDQYIISELNRPQMNYRPPSNAFGHITFDQWFLLQVNLLKKYNFIMSYAINIEMLKILLQNTLYENGISITNTGDLIDFNGERLSIDSLELRPVLIGDPIKYNEFLLSHDCVTASKFPYREEIVVKLSKPRRFLGLISLNEASFFDTRKSGSPICPPSSNGNSVSSIPIIPESLVENRNGLWNRRSSPNDLPAYPDKLWRSEKTNVKANDNGFEDISSPRGLGSEDNDYSDIGLRIIGGQAATSSGTPVSSKGRRSVNK